MRFITLVKAAETGKLPPPALWEAMEKLAKEATEAGVMIETAGLLPTAQAARVRLSEGEVRVIDGPFTETKEVVGGYAMFVLPSMKEALEWGKRFMELHKEHWPGWEGETEIRPIFGPEDLTAQCTVGAGKTT